LVKQENWYKKVLRENVDNRGSVWSETRGSVWSETRGSVCAETKGSLCSEMEGSIWAEYPGAIPGSQWNQIIFPNDKIVGVSGSLQPVPWYYTQSPAEYNINPFDPSIVAGLPPNSNVNCAPTCFMCDKIKNIYAMSNDSNYYYLEDENTYQRRRLAYELLKDSTQLMYSGSEYDADLQNFFTATSLNSIGALSNVTDLLNNNNYATAYLINENFEGTNLRELNSTFLNEICAQYYEDTITFNENQRQQLFTIAYQYPGIGGEAVYRARAILNLDLDDTQINYRLGKDGYKSTSINVYPNPSAGSFQFQYVLSEDEIATIEVYDMLGKIVYTKSLTATNSTHSIILKNCENGLYNLRLVSSNGSVYSNLLNLIK
jgi:hypothetical protein